MYIVNVTVMTPYSGTLVLTSGTDPLTQAEAEKKIEEIETTILRANMLHLYDSRMRVVMIPPKMVDRCIFICEIVQR